MQYHWADGDGRRYLDSVSGVAGDKYHPWVAEIKVLAQWFFVGQFHTAKEAKETAIRRYEMSLSWERESE
jgi:hypothetical protein